ncbi:MAG: prolyl aminopeptidase [Proteobacteria bacterium]|nr:prolyl aminopeptidase [Pseudomonadota bacterium]
MPHTLPRFDVGNCIGSIEPIYLRLLYPHCEPVVAEHLTVGDRHEIYVEQCGNSSGIPVVFLHGGPGSGCKPDHRQFFDPKRYNIILIDQRGAGRSRPFGSVEHNDTAALIDDMEAVRGRFGIDAWVLFGGSWGAALSLAYAEALPDRVLGMILRGTFLARKRDVDWFFHDGARRFLPRQWREFVDRVQAHDPHELVAFLHTAVFSDDAATVERIARAWEAWSGAVVMFSIDQAGEDANGDLTAAIAKTRIELHYAKHAYFFAENQLVDRADRIPRVPVTIVHGARDLTCTADAAWVIHGAIPESKLEIVRTAGHLSSERPMKDALVRATDGMALAISGS